MACLVSAKNSVSCQGGKQKSFGCKNLGLYDSHDRAKRILCTLTSIQAS
jgi:hypothetical protein